MIWTSLSNKITAKVNSACIIPKFVYHCAVFIEIVTCKYCKREMRIWSYFTTHDVKMLVKECIVSKTGAIIKITNASAYFYNTEENESAFN